VLGLKGDVILLFVHTISLSLHHKGRLGIIVSNKFLQTKECRKTRNQLLQDVCLKHIWDLGDTKIFDAHVLPLILFWENSKPQAKPIAMTTIYETKGAESAKPCPSLRCALSATGKISWNERIFVVNQGFLNTQNGIWTIENRRIQDWLSKVRRHTECLLKELGSVRNGLKTTANSIFIKDRDVSVWDGVEFSGLELSFPIFLTKDACAYRVQEPESWVLYPHAEDGSVLSLDGYPLSKKYLLEHQVRLASRSYIRDKKHWYKHHVAQSWSVFKKPKLVWKEIAERPEVWLDNKGFLLDGPLFFFTADQSFEGFGLNQEEGMRLLLSYLNSDFVGVFLRVHSNEKLYSNKMRCNKKNMELLPLPKLKRPQVTRLLQWVRILEQREAPVLRQKIDLFFWKAFGFDGYSNPLGE